MAPSAEPPDSGPDRLHLAHAIAVPGNWVPQRGGFMARPPPTDLAVLVPRILRDGWNKLLIANGLPPLPPVPPAADV